MSNSKGWNLTHKVRLMAIMLPHVIYSEDVVTKLRQRWTQFQHQPFFTIIYLQENKQQWQPTPVLLPGKSHGQRSLEGCSPWCCWGSDTTERLHFHFLLSCIGEGNGNSLQCSCLENPRGGEAWWAAVYGITESRTRLKWLSSSSSSLSLWASLVAQT